MLYSTGGTGWAAAWNAPAPNAEGTPAMRCRNTSRHVKLTDCNYTDNPTSQYSAPVPTVSQSSLNLASIMLSIPLTSDTDNMTSWTFIILLLIPVIFRPDTTGCRSVQSSPCLKPHQIRAPYCIALWTSCSDPNQSPLTSCIGPYRTAFWLIHCNTNWESTDKKYIWLVTAANKQGYYSSSRQASYLCWVGGWGSNKTCKTSSANCSKMQKGKWGEALQTLWFLG